MTWDATHRVYIDDSGNELSPAEVRIYIDDFIDSEQDDLDKKSGLLLAGLIPIAAFFEYLREKIVAMHGAATVIAFGGEDNVSPAQWAKTGAKIHDQLEYLTKFQSEVEQAQATAEAIALDVALAAAANPEIPAGLETVIEERVVSAIIANSVSDVDTAIAEAVKNAVADSVGVETAASVAETVTDETLDGFSGRLEQLIWGQVEARGRSYYESVFGTYENSVKDREEEFGAIGARRVTEGDDHVCAGCEGAATDEYLPLDEVSDIGEFECGGNDRCTFEFEYLNVGPLEIEREMYA